MNKYDDIKIGDKFGRLEVIKFAGRKGKNNKKYWTCKCSCKNNSIKDYCDSNLKNGNVQSCGCLVAENNKKRGIENQLSFYDWCIDNNFYNLLKRWDYDKNIISPKEIGFCVRKKIWLKCPRGIHESESYYPCDQNRFYHEDPKLKQMGYMCSKCKSFAQWGIDNLKDDFLEKYWDYNKNTVDPYIIPAHWNEKVYIKCQNDHDSYFVQCNNFTYGNRCPQCKQEAMTSKLQEKVNIYLQTKYNTILHEYGCSIIATNIKTGRKLPFDNEIKDIKLIIEVMGIQHYEITGYVKLSAKRSHVTPEDELYEMQWRDDFKKKYALKQGYEYLAIPYWYEKNDEYINIIDNKIKEITY